MIIGQDAMLERVMVALLTGGHVLLEGVPGLAKTLTIKTLASGRGQAASAASSSRPTSSLRSGRYADLRPDSGSFDTELGPVFANFLLADEINRAPAKVQSALLEVMQEQQVTIGGKRTRSRSRSSCSPPRTRSSPRAPTRCRRPRWTGSS